MCLYITATVSKRADFSQIARIGSNFGRKFSICENQYIQDQLSEDDLYFSTTKGMCDCGSVLGSINRFKTPHNDFHRKTDSLRRKGWSQSKISRWIEQQSNIQLRDERTSELRKSADIRATHDWILLINQILKIENARFFGLLLHFYRGAICSEQVNMCCRKCVDRSGLTGETLLTLDEDILYQFT